MLEMHDHPYFEIYFLEKFTRHLGLSIVSYMNMICVRAACRALAAGERNITALALSCGFNSGAYFCMVFKEQMRQTPPEYQKSRREGEKVKREILYARSERLLGHEGMERLKNAHVLVFGLGGVGSYLVEALARSGIGALTLVDADAVDPSNINRQLVADVTTVGRDKVEVERERVLAVNPECRVEIKKMLYLPERSGEFDFSAYTFVADAIDNVSAKLSLAMECARHGTPLISAMGTGNKLRPEMLEITDISKTSVCPLARVMRTELRKRGIHHLRVVYSKEEPIRVPSENGERAVGSVSFVPSVAGLMMAGEIIKSIAECK